MSHATARTHAAVSAAVVVGVVAVAVIFVAIGIAWARKAKFARKTQLMHNRSNSTGQEPHPMVMSDYQRDPTSVRLPNSPPRVYNPGSSASTSLRSGYHTSSSSISFPREQARYRPAGLAPLCATGSQHTSSATMSPVISKVEIFEDAVAAHSPLAVAVASAVTEVDTDTAYQFFGCSSLVVPTTKGAVYAEAQVKQTKCRLSHFPPGQLLVSQTSMPQLPSPPLTPTSPTLLTQASGRRNAELDTTFKFPSLPRKSTTSTLSDMTEYYRYSSDLVVEDAQEIGEDHKLWSDVFSLDDYRREDSLVLAYSSTSIRDPLPSPPLTPTVFFTPASPPSVLPTQVSSPVIVDQARLHVWRPTSKLIQDIITDKKSVTDNEEDDDDDTSAYSYNSLALFALAHGQAKAAQVRRCAQFGISTKVGAVSNFRDDSLPPYQNLGFDLESRLAQKRASSPFAQPPVLAKSTTRIFLNQVATFVRPRPPLEEFTPLLCRKVDTSKLHARPVFPGFSGHCPPTVFHKAAVSRGRTGYGGQALYATSTVSERLTWLK